MSLITTCFIILTLIFCQIVLSLCQARPLSIDTNRDESINNSSSWSTVSYNFIQNIISTMTTIGILLLLNLLIKYQGSLFDYIRSLGLYVSLPPLMTFAFLLYRRIKNWMTKRSFDLDNMKGLDYGTGLAYSYYYGYLRMVLPSTGSDAKGLIEKIENFEDNHGIIIPVHKLFILIPSSAYIPSDLKEVSCQWMESVHKLEQEKRNRAGNIGRTYCNNVYKIFPGGQGSRTTPEYVVVEGATPLLTFYEVQKHTHPDSDMYKRYKREIVMKFYTKLQEILDSEPDMKDLCELIYYNDYDSNGMKINIAKLILERLQKIRYSL